MGHELPPFCPFADGICVCDNLEVLRRIKEELRKRVQQDTGAGIPERKAIDGDSMLAAFSLDGGVESGEVSRELCDKLKNEEAG